VSDGRYIAPHIPNLRASWRWVPASRRGRFTSRKTHR